MTQQPYLKNALRAVIIGLSLFAFAASASAQATKVYSIAEFNELKKSWKDFVGSAFRIEGRYGTFVREKEGTRINMQRCSLPFRSTEQFSKPEIGSDRIDIVGQVDRDKISQELYFNVSSVNTLPSDLDVLKEKRASVKVNDAKSWYAVADWALKRGSFYEDDALLDVVPELRMGGLSALHFAHSKDANKLREIAKQADEWNLGDQGERYVAELIHEAFRVEMLNIQAKKGDYSELRTRISRELRGSQIPLVEADKPLQQKYLEKPIDIYKAADDTARERLHRSLYIEIVKQRILAELEPDGRNGFEIAARFDTDLPEFKTDAEGYRKQAMQYQRGRVGKMSRTEMLKFATTCEQRDGAAAAKEVKRDWLLVREEQLKSTGPTGLMELGDDYLSLIEDEKKAITLYTEAHRVDRTLGTAEKFLIAHGQAFNGETWVAAESLPKPKMDELDAAAKRGEILAGMNASQVGTALGVKPSSVFRAAVSGHLAEMWVYQDLGTSVEFTRRNAQSPALVVKVLNSKKNKAAVKGDAPPPDKKQTGEGLKKRKKLGEDEQAETEDKK